MNKVVRNSDWPLCVCFNKDGYIYCGDQRHMSGYFFKEELEKLRGAVEKTLLMYEEQCISDEFIISQDKDEAEREYEKFNKISHTSCQSKGDDLYLIHDVDANLLKIGRSVDAKKRIKQLQTANGHKLVLLCIISNKGFLEDDLHKKFAPYNTNGEWYEYSDDIVNEYTSLGAIFFANTEYKEKSNKLFEECWIAYRRKGVKQKARQYWNKLKESEKDMVMPHIKAYVSSRDIQYQKDFERYLRDKVFLEVVFKNNQLLYDPEQMTSTNYMPHGNLSIMWDDNLKAYLYIGFYSDGMMLADGYENDNRPDGASLVLNNGRGTITWSSTKKIWERE